VWKRLDGLIEQRQDQLIGLVQRLVQTPSISGDENAYQLLLAEEMRQIGLEVDLWYPAEEEIKQHPAYKMVDARGMEGRPGLVGKLPGAEGNGSRSLTINCHADVVPPGDLETWTYPPFAAEIANGRIYGRGACDMKANTAVGLYVLKLLREIGYQPVGEIQFHSVIGEETGGLGALYSIVRGYKTAAAIILEPTELEIVPAQAGAATFRLTIPGKAAHGCMRDEGVNPIEKFIRLHTALLELERERNRKFVHPFFEGIANKIPLSIGTINAGVWHSSVPDQLVAEGRYGVMVGETIEEAMAEFEACVQQVCAGDEWLRENPAVVEWIDGQFESAAVRQDEPILQHLQQCYRDVFGKEPQLLGVTYGSDARLLVNHAHIPTVLFGAGNIEAAHAADEYVPIEQLVPMAKTLARLIVSWCGQV
jgi:acetylornithine deacetylase